MPDSSYPDAIAGPYEPPPRTYEDREGRRIDVAAYGGGPAADEAAEFEALVEMYLAFDPEDRAQGIPPVGERRVRDWLETILGEGPDVIGWHDGRAIGHATLVPDRTGACELAIFVLAPYQNAGIGTQLMEALLGLGRERGVARVWLTVERWNRPAMAVYEKVGFVPIDDGSFELEMVARLLPEDESDDAE